MHKGPLVAVAGLLLTTACKPKEGAMAPGAGDLSLADIEAQLDLNDEILSDAGIMVAAVSLPAPTEPEPERIDEGGGGDAGSDGAELPTPVQTEPDVDPEEDMLEAGVEPSPEYESMDEPEPMAPAMDEAPRDADFSRSKGRRASRRSRKERSRCHRVCDLAEATCDLEVQICEMTERHPNEPRYELACLRAEQQCVAASQACQRCEE